MRRVALGLLLVVVSACRDKAEATLPGLSPPPFTDLKSDVFASSMGETRSTLRLTGKSLYWVERGARRGIWRTSTSSALPEQIRVFEDDQLNSIYLAIRGDEIMWNESGSVLLRHDGAEPVEVSDQPISGLHLAQDRYFTVEVQSGAFSICSRSLAGNSASDLGELESCFESSQTGHQTLRGDEDSVLWTRADSLIAQWSTEAIGLGGIDLGDATVPTSAALGKDSVFAWVAECGVISATPAQPAPQTGCDTSTGCWPDRPLETGTREEPPRHSDFNLVVSEKFAAVRARDRIRIYHLPISQCAVWDIPGTGRQAGLAIEEPWVFWIDDDNAIRRTRLPE